MLRSYSYANVILTSENFDETYASAIKFCKENNKGLYILFADDEVIAGQGTIALSFRLNFRCEFVQFGGGGLISEYFYCCKNYKSNIKITGVIYKWCKRVWKKSLFWN